MKAFISYSHGDSAMLDLLHKHLAQLQRDGIIETWTDQEIPAGGAIDDHIHGALQHANLFLALLSPDYIASNYCYTKEFQWALERQEQGTIIIVPIVVEACDWLNTPFSQFKALPKDGKAVSTWENKNTAFLDVIQHLRKLLQQLAVAEATSNRKTSQPQPAMTRNYRVQKDFDSIEKMEFIEQTFHDLKELMKRYMEEIVTMENIKVRMLVDSKTALECLLVNRNKIANESQLKITTAKDNNGISMLRSGDGQILYSVSKSNRANHGFSLAVDEYHLFWREGSFYGGGMGKQKELTAREMADIIWNEWLESVGIM